MFWPRTDVYYHVGYQSPIMVGWSQGTLNQLEWDTLRNDN